MHFFGVASWRNAVGPFLCSRIMSRSERLWNRHGSHGFCHFSTRAFAENGSRKYLGAPGLNVPGRRTVAVTATDAVWESPAGVFLLIFGPFLGHSWNQLETFLGELLGTPLRPFWTRDCAIHGTVFGRGKRNGARRRHFLLQKEKCNCPRFVPSSSGQCADFAFKTAP